jgi:chemotaxis protein CheX
MPVITKVVNPYVSATVDLLSTMAGMHAEKKDVFLKKNYRLFGDISAIMPLSGKVEGEVVVCFEEKLAREVVASIMTTQPEMLTKDELKEGIGEVVNIISGNAKAALAQSEYMHHIGLPTVIFGQGHELAHPGNAPCIVVIFEVNKQPLAVLVSMAVKTF